MSILSTHLYSHIDNAVHLFIQHICMLLSSGFSIFWYLPDLFGQALSNSLFFFWGSKGLFGSQFWVTAYHCGEIEVAGTWSNWSHDIISQEPRIHATAQLAFSTTTQSRVSCLGNDLAYHFGWAGFSNPHLLVNYWWMGTFCTVWCWMPGSAC